MKLLVSALEHSANVHLTSLTKEFTKDVQLIGIFDKNLGNPIVDLQSLAIMGIVDALKKLRYFFKLADEMVDLAAKADKVLLIDSSGFNLPLAKKIKKKYPNKEIIYYILPQAWAWKKKRIPILTKTIDKLASILPFEPSYYPSDAPIEYVGHPLLDQIKEFKTSLNAEVKTVAFMPGSRKGEIKKLMPIYLKLIQELNAEATIIIPKHFSTQEIEELYGDLSGINISYEAHKTLLNADFAFICSGTATLEAAIIGVPFILTYIAKPLDFFIGAKLFNIKDVGLSNIMFKKFKGESIHPEFLQEEVSVKNLIKSFKEYDREKFFKHSDELREYLKHGSSAIVAKLIED
ncbi:lipid-A-disaccharide synthase [Sulfurimonas sp. SAG-AH-194-C20]|nr:lipid-A-disaccharide synthase [Sulfurimonas sp. SAG-AH-194-C20]MDF1878869.1 lipid-A-disaccharide synthase [Sulfurimonas sp. SAG-AH-194-C20]